MEKRRQVIERDSKIQFVNQRLLHEEVGAGELLPVLLAEAVICAEPSINPFIAA